MRPRRRARRCSRRAQRRVDRGVAAPRWDGRQHHRRRTARRPGQPPPAPVGGAAGACLARRAPRRRPPGAAPQRAAAPRWPLGGVPAAGPPTSCGPSRSASGPASPPTSSPARCAGRATARTQSSCGPGSARRRWRRSTARWQPSCGAAIRRRLSADLARRRIAVNDGGRLLRRVARGARPAGRTFLYPAPRLRRGRRPPRRDQRSRPARASRPAAASTCSSPVGRCASRSTTGGGSSADRVLWTAPLDALVGVVAGAPDVAPPGHRGVVLVYLVLDEDRYSEFDAHYVPDPDVAFARLSEPKNYRDGPDPAGRTVLCAEVPATVGDACWAASDDALAQLVLDGMDRLGLRRPAVAGVEVVRLPRVYPVIGVDDDARRARARRGPTASTASPCSGARASPSPTTSITSSTWRSAPSNASVRTAGTRRGGEPSAPASTRSWWTTDGRARCGRR